MEAQQTLTLYAKVRALLRLPLTFWPLRGLKEYITISYLKVLMFVIIAVALIALAIAMMKLFHLKTIPIITIILALAVLGVSLFVTQVPTGFTGVLTTFGRVEDRALDPGLNVKMPWRKIVTIDNREQRVPFNFNAFSSDIQQTTVSGSINFQVNPKSAMTLIVLLV